MVVVFGAGRSRISRFLPITVVAVMCCLTVVACAKGPVPAKQEILPAWPERDITLIVGFKPGGGQDLTARVVQPFIEKYLPKRVNVVVKNVPGAGGKTAIMELFRAKPDGYTLAITNAATLAPMQVMGELGSYDISSLTWLAQLHAGAPLVVRGVNSRFKAAKDMVGQDVRFASTSALAFPTLVLAQALGCQPKLILYDGSAEAAMAVMRGDADAISLLWTAMMRQVEASEGKLIPMFVAANERVGQLPNIPCAKESGFSVEESVVIGRHIIVAPAGLPPEVARTLEDVMEKVLNDADFTRRMEESGSPVVPLGSREVSSLVREALKATEGHKNLLVEAGQ